MATEPAATSGVPSSAAGDDAVPSERAARPWYCAVKWCDEPVVVFTLTDVDLDGVQAQAMVPFCHEHGPKTGGAV